MEAELMSFWNEIRAIVGSFGFLALPALGIVGLTLVARVISQMFSD
jgi:hypothetical protein